MSRVLRFSKSLMAATSSKATSAPASVAAASAQPAKKPAGIMKPAGVSPTLRRFLGVAEISRPQAVKKIWEHIKSHSLQDPMNKREIRLDDKLKTIFGNRDKISMFEIAKLLSPHFNKSS